MKCRWISLLVVFLFILPTAVLTASANSAPEPDFVLRFSGIEGTCYMTLLNREKEDEWGIHHVSEDGKRDPEVFDIELFGYRKADEIADPVFQAFYNYKDPDGYYFVQQMADLTDRTSYYDIEYPHEFKILLYYPESGKFISSEKLEAHSYFNCFHITVENDEIVSVTKSTKYAEYGMNVGEVLYILCLLIQTIIIEILVAIPFGFRRKKQVLTVFLTNLLTHPLMMGMIMVVNPSLHESVFSFPFVFFEIGVAVIESLVYLWLFPKFEKERSVKKWLIIVYAATANLVTYAISALIPETILGWIFGRLVYISI